MGFVCSFTECEFNTLKIKMCIFWLIKAILYLYLSFDHFNIHHQWGIHKQHIICKIDSSSILFYFLRRVYFLTRPSVIISNSVVQCCYRFRLMGNFGPFEFWLYIEFSIEQIVSAIPFKLLQGFRESVQAFSTQGVLVNVTRKLWMLHVSETLMQLSFSDFRSFELEILAMYLK